MHERVGGCCRAPELTVSTPVEFAEVEKRGAPIAVSLSPTLIFIATAGARATRVITVRRSRLRPPL
jgi:hypothetical protein